MLGLPVAGAVFVRQVKIERKAADAAAVAGRARTRAEEILTDYEETGQGWFWEADRRGMLTNLSRTVAEAATFRDPERWSQEDRVEVEFSSMLDLDERGAIASVGLRVADADWKASARKTG